MPGLAGECRDSDGLPACRNDWDDVVWQRMIPYV